MSSTTPAALTCASSCRVRWRDVPRNWLAMSLWCVVALAVTGCVSAPRDAALEPFDWDRYVDLVPCDFDLSCAGGSTALQLQFVEPDVPSTPVALVDAVGSDAVKPYLQRISTLEHALQQERLARAQLEREVKALREIDREIARASGQATP